MGPGGGYFSSIGNNNQFRACKGLSSWCLPTPSAISHCALGGIFSWVAARIPSQIVLIFWLRMVQRTSIYKYKLFCHCFELKSSKYLSEEVINILLGFCILKVNKAVMNLNAKISWKDFLQKNISVYLQVLFIEKTFMWHCLWLCDWQTLGDFLSHDKHSSNILNPRKIYLLMYTSWLLIWPPLLT